MVFASDPKVPEGSLDPKNHPGFVQVAGTLSDAYDRLLVTSAGAAAYKAAVVQAWDKQWTEQATPQEFIDASQKTADS